MGDMIKTHTKSVNEKPQLVKKMQIIHKKGGGPTQLGVAVGYMICVKKNVLMCKMVD